MLLSIASPCCSTRARQNGGQIDGIIFWALEVGLTWFESIVYLTLKGFRPSGRSRQLNAPEPSPPSEPLNSHKLPLGAFLWQVNRVHNVGSLWCCSACSAYRARVQPIPLLFRQRFRICDWDRCSPGRDRTLKESDVGKSRMRGGYEEQKVITMFVFSIC